MLWLALGSCLFWTDQNSSERIGAKWCERYNECDKANFELEYRDVEACGDDFMAYFGPADFCQLDAGCEWNRADAKACYEELDLGSCEDYTAFEWLNDCDHVWSCTSSQIGAATLCLADQGDIDWWSWYR